MWNRHGGDIYRNTVAYDFSTNINPLGMPDGCREALAAAISLAGVYPDPAGEALCRQIAKAERVEAHQVILGNGSAELIYGLCYAVKPKKVILPVPTFSEYEEAVKAAGGNCVFVELEERKGFRLGKNAHSLVTVIDTETDLVFLCNPNNPTGATIDPEGMMEIVKKCQQTGTRLCVDECFLPFLEVEHRYTLKGQLHTFPQLVILRAFTKLYGMPGLRLGYALSADRELLGRMRQCLPPWNTSAIAQKVGLAALQDQGFVEKTRAVIQRERAYLMEKLQACGSAKDGLLTRIYASEANFIFFKGRGDLQTRLLEKGILIRDCSNYRNLTEGYFRIAVKSHEENEVLIATLQNLLY